MVIFYVCAQRKTLCFNLALIMLFVCFGFIMTFAFFNNLHLKVGCLFQFENNQFYLVARRPNSSKTLNVLVIGVYLHSQSQRFFVDVSFKFSNNRYRYTAYGSCAILLSLMQCSTGHLLTLQDIDFLTFLWT